MISYWGVAHGDEISKKEKKDYSGAAVGTGATVGTVGLVGGGLPGTKAKRTLADVKNASGRRSQANNLQQAYRGGEFGYRQNAHHTYKTFSLGGDAPANASRADMYHHGRKVGKIVSEDKILRHLAVGRKASNVALVGGAALAGAGAYKHHKRKEVRKAKKKDDNFGTHATIGVGASTAGLGYGAAHGLEHQGRAWSKRSAKSIGDAEKLNPRAKGYKVVETKTKVPDVVPRRGDKALVTDKKVFAGRSKEHAAQVGALRGNAAQERYFAATYGKVGGLARKVGLVGAGVAGAGAATLGAKHLHNKWENRNKVKKNLAMPKRPGAIPGVRAAIDYEGKMFKPPLSRPGEKMVETQRVLHTVRPRKRKLVRTGARANQRALSPR